jgi:hypothetical protein
MYEEDWGFFVDLEVEEKKIKNQSYQENNYQYQKKILNTELNLHYLPVIYEEYEWYTNDSPESEYHFKIDIYMDGENNHTNTNKETQKSCKDNRTSMIIYYIFCASFICLAFII